MPKIWYFIANQDASKLETAVNILYDECDFTLRHKISVIPPDTLDRLGIQYWRVWF